MAATPTTRSQVQAYRFMLRRMEHALVRKDTTMVHDPMRSQLRAIAVGLVLAVLALAGFALVSVFRPAEDVSRATILIGKDSAQPYVVRVEDGVRVLHPVLNLASARLVAGQPAAAVVAADSVLAAMPRGPVLGIPGGPNQLPGPDQRPDPVWTVCDTAAGSNSADLRTTIVVGALGAGAAALTGDQALAVRAPDGSLQLLYDGRRAVVDTTKNVVNRALNLSSVVARPVSAGLLNAVPEVAPITVPEVPGAGQVPAYPVSGLRVGAVVSVTATSGSEFYVLLREYVQKVPELVATLLASSSGGVVAVSGNALAQVPDAPAAARLPVQNYPSRAPQVLHAADAPVGCLSWRSRPTEAEPGAGVLALLAGTRLPVPAQARPVALAGADDGSVAVPTVTGGATFRLDTFYLQPGRLGVVQTLAAGQVLGVGARRLVTDTGTTFGIEDAATATVLGLGPAASAAPESIVSLLPRGPALTAAAALVAHDGVAADPAGVPQPLSTR